MKKKKHITMCETGGEGNENETEVLACYVLQCICGAEGDYGKIIEISSQNKQLYHNIDDIYYRTDQDITCLIDNKKNLSSKEIIEILVKGYLDFLNPQFIQKNLRIQITTQSNSNGIEKLRNLFDRSRNLQTFDRYERSLSLAESIQLEKYRKAINKDIRVQKEVSQEEFFYFLQIFFIVPINLGSDGNPIKAIFNKMLASYFKNPRVAITEVTNYARQMKKKGSHTRSQLIKIVSNLDILNLEFRNPSDLPRTKEAPFLKIVALIGGWDIQDEPILAPFLCEASFSYVNFVNQAEQLIAGSLLSRNDESYQAGDQEDLLTAFRNDIFSIELERFFGFAREVFLKRKKVVSQRLKMGLAIAIKFFTINPHFFSKDPFNIPETKIICAQIFEHLNTNSIRDLGLALPELAETHPKAFLIAMDKISKSSFPNYSYPGLWAAFIRVGKTNLKYSCSILVQLAVKNRVGDDAINILSQILGSIPNEQLDDFDFLLEGEVAEMVLHLILSRIRRISKEICSCKNCEINRKKRYFFSKIYLPFFKQKANFLGLYLELLDLSAVEDFVLRQDKSLQEIMRISIWDRYKDREYRVNRHRDLELKSFCKKMEPQTDIGKVTYLFSFSSPRFKSDKKRSQEDILANERRKAIEMLLKSDGISGLLQLIDNVNNPALVGQALINGNYFRIYHKKICELIPQCNNPKIKDFFKEYVKGYSLSYWLQYLKSQGNRWNTLQKLHFLTLHAFSKEIYELVKIMDIESDYWKLLDKGNILRNRAKIVSHIPRAYLLLLEYGRYEEAAWCMEYCLKHNKISPDDCILFLQKLPRDSSNDIICKTVDHLQNNCNLNSHQTDELINLQLKYIKDFTLLDKLKLATLKEKAAQDSEFFYQQVLSETICFDYYWNRIPHSFTRFIEELKIKCSSNPEKWAKVQFVLAHGAAKYIRKNLLDLDKLGEEFLKALDIHPELRKYFFTFLEEDNIKQLNIEDIDKIIKKYALEEKLNIVKEIRTKCIWS